MSDDVELLYDKDCPVCEYYCQRIDIESSTGNLVRVDARDESDVMNEVTAMGLDIDEGMVLKKDGEIYYGSEAIHQLALLSNRKGFVNRLAYWTFRSEGTSRFLYPILKACRNLLLKLLGRSRINNLEQEGRDRF
ncbi:MAG: DCC1-like thiol-disulfide oxidoreductase family protein [Pseudomonadota bacterium]